MVKFEIFQNFWVLINFLPVEADEEVEDAGDPSIDQRDPLDHLKNEIFPKGWFYIVGVDWEASDYDVDKVGVAVDGDHLYRLHFPSDSLEDNTDGDWGKESTEVDEEGGLADQLKVEDELSWFFLQK